MTPLRIALSGASGMLGGALLTALAADGHTLTRLLRRAPRGPGELRWDPARGDLDAAALEGLDAVIHLSGENIAAGRWNAARKARLRTSRVGSSALLASRLATCARPPRALLCASAVGFYGDRGDERLDEGSAAGQGFFPALCRDWEAAASPAAAAGIRVVHLRFGVLLGAEGGALGRMLPIFRLGLGGPLGSGRQWLSWLSLEDATRAVRFALANESLAGPVNLVSPAPVRQRDFARALGRALHRPALLPAPAFALRLLLGEMADAALLASAAVHPGRLEAAGFTWRHPRLDDALAAVL